MAKRHFLALATMVFSLAAASTASAQTCTSDGDCLQGFSCVVSGTSASPPCKGADCAPPTTTDPVVYKSCQPKACSADSDCGVDMVCHEETSTGCSGGGSRPACAPNTDCDAGVVTVTETCTTTSHKFCAFKWQLPCNADSDCGAAFTCNPSVSGTCSGGFGTASPASTSGGAAGTAGTDSRANSAPPDAVDASAPVCTTTSSFPGWCAPKATTCATNSDCPSGWTCTTVPGPAPAQTRGSVPASDGGASAPALLDAGAPTSPMPVQQCVGPYGYGYPMGGATDGRGTSTSTGGTAGAGGGAPSVPPAGSAAGGPTGTDYGPHGGCAVGPAHGGSAFALLGFAALLLAYRRRRA